MSDDIDVSGEEPIAPVGEVAPPPAAPIIKRGALSRNVLLIIAGVIVVVVAAGFVVYALSLAGNTPAPAGSSVPITTPSGGAPAGGTASTVTSGTLPELSAIDNDDVFSPKNPFVVIKPMTITLATSSSSGSSDTSGTLYCTKITSVDGTLTATVRYDGVSYTVKAGDTVDSSPYSIVQVYSTYVLVQYGDIQFTIKPKASSSESGS